MSRRAVLLAAAAVGVLVCVFYCEASSEWSVMCGAVICEGDVCESGEGESGEGKNGDHIPS